MIRADGAVTPCGEVCGLLGTTGGSLRVPGGGLTKAVVPGCHSVDRRGTVISLPTGRDGKLSTIHRPTTTAQDRNKKKYLEKTAREGQ
jgi:hypothetical protein